MLRVLVSSNQQDTLKTSAILFLITNNKNCLLITDGSPLKSENSNGTDSEQSLITEAMRKEEEVLQRKTMREEAEQKRKAMEVRVINNIRKHVELSCTRRVMLLAVGTSITNLFRYVLLCRTLF